MKNQSKLMMAVLMILTSITANAIEKPINTKTGVFGVCNCDNKNSKSNIIELTINPDATFNYIDNSDVNNKVTLTGTWINKGNKVYLIASDNRKSFHRKWKYTKNGQCIKSRYKLEYRRICLIKPC